MKRSGRLFTAAAALLLRVAAFAQTQTRTLNVAVHGEPPD